MNEEQIARFEANIERLVENAFATFFGKKIRAQDIALQLARTMEDHLRPASGGDPRLIAPDHYRIFINPQVYDHLTQLHTSLPETLSEHVVTLATQSDYRMLNTPMIEFISDPSQDLLVTATHTNRPDSGTAAMKEVVTVVSTEAPERAFIMINAENSIPLTEDLINIGRNRDNDIVLDDPYVSRHHIQMRRRGGTYLLFDVSSQTGTFVNGVRIKEHQLQTGDVIQIGKTRIVYMEDRPMDDSSPLPQTDTLDPSV